MIIEKINGSRARVEVDAGHFAEIELSRIDGDAHEGAVIVLVGQGRYRVDEAATRERKEQAKARLRRLMK